MADVDSVLFASLHSAQVALSDYEASQELRDLQVAVEHAIDLASAPALPEQSVRFQADALHLSARAVLARFGRFGDSSDLTTARLWLGQAQSLSGPDTPDAAGYLDSLSTGLAERYEQTHDVAFLKEALSLAEEAVALTSNCSCAAKRLKARHADRFQEAAMAKKSRAARDVTACSVR